MSDRSEEFISSVKSPGYEVPGRTRIENFPSWHADTAPGRTRRLTSMLGDSLPGYALRRLQEFVAESKLEEALSRLATFGSFHVVARDAEGSCRATLAELNS